MFVLPPMDVASVVTLEDRTELRGRIVEGTPVMDVETDPRVTLRVSRRNDHDAFTVAYLPRLVFTNFAGKEAEAPAPGVLADDDTRQIDLLHQGNLLLESQRSQRTKLFSNNFIQYGKTSISTLLVQPRWNGEDRPALPRPFPLNPRVRFNLLALNLGGGVFHLITPRWSIQPSVFYQTWGGPDFEARKRLNYLQNPGVSIESTYALRPTDDLLFLLQPQVNVFTTTVVDRDTNGAQLAEDGTLFKDQEKQTPRYVSRDGAPLYQINAEARLRHRFTNLVLGEVAVGANATSQKRPDDPLDPFDFRGGSQTTQNQVFPMAEVLANAGFKTSFARGRVVAYTRLGSWLNLLTGNIQSRTEHVGAASFTFGRTVLRAQAALMITLPGETFAFRQVTGELGMERRFTPELALDLGVRIGQQSATVANFARQAPTDPETTETSSVQPGAFVGFSYQPRGFKF
jgi:hypothetical protein